MSEEKLCKVCEKGNSLGAWIRKCGQCDNQIVTLSHDEYTKLLNAPTSGVTISTEESKLLCEIYDQICTNINGSISKPLTRKLMKYYRSQQALPEPPKSSKE